MKNFSWLVCCLSLLLSSVSAQAICGNPQTPTRPPKKDCPPGQSTEGGDNPFDVYTGSVSRTVIDLVVYGGVGEEPLQFKRTSTSRYLGAVATPLGSGGSWRHNYQWNIYYGGANANGSEIIAIDYPDGNNWRFDLKNASDLYLTAVSQTEDCVQQDKSNSAQYYLCFADGGRLSFTRTGTGSNSTYQIQGLYDKYGLYYTFTLDTKGRVTRVTEPAGRWIGMTYGPIGNFGVANVAFSYSNSSAGNVYLAGNFNNWSTTATPMTKDAQGNWTVTVPMQLGTWQYKFVVDGTWIPDPNNPNHIPAGAGNNSAVTVSNNDQGTSTSQPTPVSFTYSNGSASSVSIAGDFNGWSTTANAMTQSGSNWTATVNIPNGMHLYKLVINGNQWIADPANPFTDPDGYGGSNSKLAVGPYDEAMTQVQTSDGRSVSYAYAVSSSFGTIYSALNQVTYGDGTVAHYTYVAPFTSGGRPILATADDPRYEGAATRVAYTYQNTGVDGFVSQEKSLVSGVVLASLSAPDESTRYVAYANGGTHTYAFSNYQLNSHDDGTGDKLSTTYTAGGYGMVNGSADGLGNATTYDRTTYFGAITKTTNADGSFRSVTFTDPSKPFFVQSITDELGHTTTYGRDPASYRATQITYADQSYETFTYNSFGQILTHRMRKGGTESFTYDQRGLKTAWTDASGFTWTYTYDAADRLAGVSDPLQHTTTYQYNERGLLTKAIYADNSFVSYAYDAYGNRTSMTNELGKVWTSVFDEFKRLTSKTDPLNRTISYSYAFATGSGNSAGCSSCQTSGYPASVTLPSGKSTSYTYDYAWRKTSETVATNTVDAATTSFGYDANGNLVQVVDPRGKVTTHAYDNRNRRITTTDPLNHQLAWTYDAAGNMLSVKRADGNSTVYTYDSVNRRTQSKDSLNQITAMGYDMAGNLVSLTDARNNSYGFAYDLQSRKTSMTYPDASHEDWTFNGVGNIVTYRTRAGQVRTVTYDTRNRQTDSVWNDGSTPEVTTTYDLAGRVLTMNNVNSALSYTYDDAGQLLSETQNPTGGPGAKTVAYAYNADGKRLQLTNPDGTPVTYTYTARNQLQSISLSGPPPLATYSYDLAGNRVGTSLENGTSVAYSYDDANRLTSLVNRQGSTVLSSFAYAYNSVNNRTSVTYASGLGDVYNYDSTDQLTGVQYSAANPAGTPTSPQSTQSYVYDAVGNRTSTSQNGVSTSYSANSLDQYTSNGSSTLSYDANGNLTVGLGNSSGWTYDAQNRLTNAYFNQKQGRIYVLDIAFSTAYDARNRPVKRVIGGGAPTYYVYDQWSLVGEYSGGSQTKGYVDGWQVDEILVCTNSSTNPTYYHYDGLGNTVALVDSNGQVVEQYNYDVFGQPTIKNASGTVLASSAYGNRFLFTGREWLANIGVYDYRSRVYSPSLGRFLQTDSIKFDAEDVNIYRYVFNSPLVLKDPFGTDVQLNCGSDGCTSGGSITGVSACTITSLSISGGLGACSGAAKLAGIDKSTACAKLTASLPITIKAVKCDGKCPCKGAKPMDGTAKTFTVSGTFDYKLVTCEFSASGTATLTGTVSYGTCTK